MSYQHVPPRSWDDISPTAWKIIAGIKELTVECVLFGEMSEVLKVLPHQLRSLRRLRINHLSSVLKYCENLYNILEEFEVENVGRICSRNMIYFLNQCTKLRTLKIDDGCIV